MKTVDFKKVNRDGGTRKHLRRTCYYLLKGGNTTIYELRYPRSSQHINHIQETHFRNLKELKDFVNKYLKFKYQKENLTIIKYLNV